MKQSVAAFAKSPADLGPRLLSSSSHEVASVILTILHLLTYLPLVLLPVMQDAHLKLVIVLNTSLCLCLMAGNVVFHGLGVVKVFPKTLDTFLLALYASMVPVVFLQFKWLADWINVYHSGAVACFLWLTILLPCWDSFASEAIKDRLPEELWDLPAVRAAGLRVSQVWALVLTLCALATLPPVMLTERHRWEAVHIICDYVIVLLLLLVAAAMQWGTTARLMASTAGPDPPQCSEEDFRNAAVAVTVHMQPQQPQETPCPVAMRNWAAEAAASAGHACVLELPESNGDTGPGKCVACCSDTKPGGGSA